jgi:hypothetical protein
VERDKRVRLFHLAKEWKVESKVLVELCQRLGITASNQLSGLYADEVDRLRDAVAARQPSTASKPAVPPPLPGASRSAEPVPAVLVAPVPAPVWNQSLGARAADATAKPAAAVPAEPPAASTPPAPPPKPAAATQPVSASPPPAAQPARAPAARTAPPAKATPRAVAPPPQRKIATPASDPVPPPQPTTATAPPPKPDGPVRNPGIDHLLAVGARGGLEALELIPRLAEIDTASAVFKLLQITERLCRKVLGARGPRELDVMIGEIDQRNLLGKKAVSYLRHLHNLGEHATNSADTPAEEAFTLLDVNNAAATLASVVEAAIAAKRLGTR